MNKHILVSTIVMALLLKLYYATGGRFTVVPESKTVIANELFNLTCAADGVEPLIWTLGNKSSFNPLDFPYGNSTSNYVNEVTTSTLTAAIPRTMNGSCCKNGGECVYFKLSVEESHQPPKDNSSSDASGESGGYSTFEDTPNDTRPYAAFSLPAVLLIGIIGAVIAVVWWRCSITHHNDSVNEVKRKVEKEADSPLTAEETVSEDVRSETMSMNEISARHRTPRHVQVDRGNRLEQDDVLMHQVPDAQPIGETKEATHKLFQVELQLDLSGADEGPRDVVQEQASTGQSKPVYNSPASTPIENLGPVVCL